jgi:hypothetical protein
VKLAINGFAAILAALVVLIFAIAKFTEGAWVVVVLFPILVVVLIRLHHTYADEQAALERNLQSAAEVSVLAHHVVLVFIERFDLSAARALQYARSVSAGEPRAVHFVLDTAEARRLEDEWVGLGLARVTLDLVECPDRRLGRAALEYVAQLTRDGETEVTVLLPRRVFETPLRRVLHDRTAERISGLIAELPNATATIIPFQLGRRRYRLPDDFTGTGTGSGTDSAPPAESADVTAQLQTNAPPGTRPISTLRWRERARVAGRVHSVRLQSQASAPSLECVIVDETGQLLIVFPGRRMVPGIEPGARILVEGILGAQGRRPAMTNPSYTILQEHDGGARR